MDKDPIHTGIQVGHNARNVKNKLAKSNNMMI